MTVASLLFRHGRITCKLHSAKLHPNTVTNDLYAMYQCSGSEGHDDFEFACQAKSVRLLGV